MAKNLLLPVLNKIRIPSAFDTVYKDECIYSFDNPESEHGLFICMNSFLAFGRNHVEIYHRRTSNSVFLHLKRIKREIEKDENLEPESKKPTRLAIGVEGGFDLQNKKYDIQESYTIVVLPDWTVLQLSDPDIPPQVLDSANAIIAADSAAKQAELAALANTWDGEARMVSKFADNLLQLDTGKKVPPSGWRCEKCDLKENLWLNLTDGMILCGRRYFDGTGGNNHASEHYHETQYPLAVKLGTITPDGADVYSYAEDDMVLDPGLPLHLAHFGIDIMKMEKTDKTMLEMELDLNQRAWEWDRLTESGSQLQPVYGPGYTGIHNLGNSCYMNSVLQVLFTIPQFISKYYTPAAQIFTQVHDDPTSNFNVQMAKLGHGLLSGDYSREPVKDSTISYPQGICPRMFKTLVGKGHHEFSSNHQQDSAEYLLHLFSIIERNSVGSPNPTDSIKFRLEDRIECSESTKVKYMYRNEFVFTLPIPLEAAINRAEVAAFEEKKASLEAQGKKVDPGEVVRPQIKLSSCLEAFATQSLVEDFYSSALKRRTIAKKSTRLGSFPDYLFIQLQKFSIGSDWVERKLDVSVDMPDEIDVSPLRGRGKQPNEEELPEESSASAPKPAIVIDESMVSELMGMGFAFEGCRKAVYFTQGQGMEAAVNWIMEHMDDADFDVPLQVETESEFMADDASVTMITSMGFTNSQAVRALKATDNNVERAMEWIFSHMDELDQPEATPAATNQQPAAAPAASGSEQFTDGSGRYRLVAFISHMGTSSKFGHYVCHILKEGRWIIFNDDKVAISENPPKDLAYLYLYRRL